VTSQGAETGLGDMTVEGCDGVERRDEGLPARCHGVGTVAWERPEGLVTEAHWKGRVRSGCAHVLLVYAARIAAGPGPTRRTRNC
jgi:hypothetical protein